MPNLKIKFKPEYKYNLKTQKFAEDLAKTDGIYNKDEVSVEIERYKLPLVIMKKLYTDFFDNESIWRDFPNLVILTAIAKEKEKQEDIDRNYIIKITLGPNENNIKWWQIDFELRRGA